MDPVEPIVVEAEVPLPPRDAFLAFTSHMGKWWDPVLSPDPATFSGIDLDPRGEVALRHGRDRYVWGEVTRWEPPTAYEQTFWLGHSPDHPTTLSVTFSESDEGTRVRLEHGGWSEETADARAKFTHWQDLMTRYAAHAAR